MLASGITNITSQINKGSQPSTTVWNDGVSFTVPTSATPEHLEALTEIRRVNRLSEQDRYMYYKQKYNMEAIKR